MSTKLKIVDASVLSKAEQIELDASIDSLIAAHKTVVRKSTVWYLKVSRP